jgi:hypothetical protein
MTNEPVPISNNITSQDELSISFNIGMKNRSLTVTMGKWLRADF